MDEKKLLKFKLLLISVIAVVLPVVSVAADGLDRSGGKNRAGYSTVKNKKPSANNSSEPQPDMYYPLMP